MSNTAWSLLLTVVLILLTLIAVRLRPRAATVVVLHNVVWLGAIVLIGTNLIDYHESSATAWLTLLGGILAFNLGSIVAFIPTKTTAFVAPPASVEPLVGRGVVAAMLLVYAASVAIYLVTIEQRFGIYLLISDPAQIRGATGESYLESVPVAARFGMYLGPFLLALMGFNGSMRNPFSTTTRLVLVVALAASMMLLLQRTNVFMAVLWLVALYLSREGIETATTREQGTRTRHSLMRRALPFAAVGTVLIAIFLVIGGALGKTGQQALSTGAVSGTLAASGLTDVYGYYTAGVVAFLQLTDSDDLSEPPPHVQGKMRLGAHNAQTWGATTFAPILKVVPGAEPPDSIYPFIDTGVLTNVFTWLEPFYRDFRALGVTTGMLLLGFGMTRMFVNRFHSPITYWTQAAFLSTVFLATFALKLNNTLFLFGLGIVILGALVSGSDGRRSAKAIAPQYERTSVLS